MTRGYVKALLYYCIVVPVQTVLRYIDSPLALGQLVVPCRAMLCCLLWCAVLPRAMMWCAVLPWAMMWCTVLPRAMMCSSCA